MPPVVVAAVLLAARFHGPVPLWVTYASAAALLVIFSIVCVVHGEAAEVKWGKDPGEVVADEVAGQSLTLLLLPMVCFHDPWRALAWLGAGFVLFRVLDIVKPWPARGLQRVRGGWGILLDDLFAGAYAGIVLHLLARLVVHG
jgi:phosphatidylglycerophosphatase A